MVSPGCSEATADRLSVSWRSQARTTASRIRSWIARMGSSSAATSGIVAALAVVRIRHGTQLRGLLFRGGVVQEITAADFGTREILEQSRFAQRGMDLHVEVEARIADAVG